MDDLTTQASPCIGIFWWYRGELIHLTRPWAEITPVAGAVSLPSSHYEHWDEIRAGRPELRSFEYEEVPRGRVVAKLPGPRFTVYTSRRLTEDEGLRAAVIEAFRLRARDVAFRPDEHYEHPAGIDWGDD